MLHFFDRKICRSSQKIVTLQCKSEGKQLQPPRAKRFDRRRHDAATVSTRRSAKDIDIMYCLAPRPPKTGQTVNGDTLREIDAKSKGRPRDGRVKKQKTPGANYFRRLHCTETDCGTGAGYCSLSVWTIRADIV